jgi:hypothetical protein
MSDLLYVGLTIVVFAVLILIVKGSSSRCTWCTPSSGRSVSR